MGRVWIDSLTFADALDAIELLIENNQGGTVYTPNVDHVVVAETNPGFAEAYNRASLSLVDGQALVWASRLLGFPLPERVSGADLLMPLLERAASRCWRVYLFGGSPGVAEEVVETVAASGLDVHFVGTDASTISLDPDLVIDQSIVDRIRTARPDLVFVALGAPKQELLIDRIIDQISPAVAIGVGAAFDFAAGRIARAPHWVSESGFEWLYRLIKEPRRLWRRYLFRDPKMVPILFRTRRSPLPDRVLLASDGAAAASAPGRVESLTV
jgi:N-acetylglucosaminyldiphosphoundecaprenol N-acetyl-beta-D-mannosaminyltransferase